MKKKRGKQINIQINLSNRWLYTFIAIGILMVIGVGVYALVPGIAPNPGHLIDNVAPPTDCAAGQILGWDGTVWNCVDMPEGSIDTDTRCDVSGTCSTVYGSVLKVTGTPVVTPGSSCTYPNNFGEIRYCQSGPSSVTLCTCVYRLVGYTESWTWRAIAV